MFADGVGIVQCAEQSPSPGRVWMVLRRMWVGDVESLANGSRGLEVDESKQATSS
jgi:hypothetical protein